MFVCFFVCSFACLTEALIANGEAEVDLITLETGGNGRQYLGDGSRTAWCPVLPNGSKWKLHMEPEPFISDGTNSHWVAEFLIPLETEAVITKTPNQPRHARQGVHKFRGNSFNTETSNIICKLCYLCYSCQEATCFMPKRIKQNTCV